MIRILSDYTADALEKALNKVIEGNPSAKLIHLSVHPMHDVYMGQTPTVCNSWSEYLAAVEVP